MTHQKKKEEFLALRIAGETFQAISEKLGVSKQTLINWSKEAEIKESISTARLIHYQKILRLHEQNREAKIEFFACLAHKVKQELMSRDLSEVPADKLLKIILDSEAKLNDLVPAREFGGDFQEIDFGGNPSFYFNPED